MKKSLIALAAMAAAGVASAQSSVTLFGILDATFTHVSASGSGSLNTLRSDGYNSSRLGFRGTEDLGGGLSASFWLEAGINVDSGAGSNTTANNTAAGDKLLFGTTAATTSAPGASSLNGRQGLTFNRRSTVSLAGGWGELRVGRDYVPTFWNMTIFDPFGTNGVGSSLNVTLGALNPFANSAFPPGSPAPQVRSSNSIGYFLPPNLGGFYGQLMYALADVPNDCSQPLANFNGNTCQGAKNDGRYIGGRLGYATGPFNVALAYGRATYGDVVVAPAAAVGNATQQSAFRGDYTQWNLGGQWDFGMAKLLAQIGEQRHDSTAVNVDQKLRHYLIGALVPVGAGEIRLSYNLGRRTDGGDAGVLGSNDGARIRQIALGYVHNLSKRTAVYATYAQQRVSGGTGLNVATLGLNSAPGGSQRASGFDLGIRHSF
jgi:predicted porin